MNATPRCLSMGKGEHRYVFQYHEGCESTLLASFVALANDPRSEFDWFDAAVLSYQLGDQLTNQFEPVAQLE